METVNLALTAAIVGGAAYIGYELIFKDDSIFGGVADEFQKAWCGMLGIGCPSKPSDDPRHIVDPCFGADPKYCYWNEKLQKYFTCGPTSISPKAQAWMKLLRATGEADYYKFSDDNSVITAYPAGDSNVHIGRQWDVKLDQEWRSPDLLDLCVPGVITYDSKTNSYKTCNSIAFSRNAELFLDAYRTGGAKLSISTDNNFIIASVMGKIVARFSIPYDETLPPETDINKKSVAFQQDCRSRGGKLSYDPNDGFIMICSRNNVEYRFNNKTGESWGPILPKN
jgi:hypothetical protein